MARNKNKKKGPTRSELAQRVLYFAYGSNMHQPRLVARVGEVICLGTYLLQDYKLTFDTGSPMCAFANVDQIPGEICEGVIYEMSYAQLLILDYYEGLYERVKEDYKGRRLHIYISNRHRNRRMEPMLTKNYHKALVLGCTAHNLRRSLAIVEQYKPQPGIFNWKDVVDSCD